MAETTVLAASPTPAATEALSPEDAADRAEELKKPSKEPEPKESDDDDPQEDGDRAFYGEDEETPGKLPDSKIEDPKPKEKKPEAKEEKKKTETEGEKSDETTPPPNQAKAVDSPPPPDLVEVELRGSRHKVPKEAADALQEIQEEAQALKTGLQEQVKLLAEKPMETLFDHLTHHLGSRELAYKRLLDEAAQVVRQEVEYQSLPPEQRQAQEYQKKAQALEAELARYKKQEADEKASAQRAQATERLMRDIVGGFKQLNIPQEKELAFEAAKAVEFLRDQGKKVNVLEVIKYFKGQKETKEKERLTLLEEKQRQLSIEEFAKQYPERVSQLREWDVSRLESEKRAKAKTPPKAEPEAKPPSKQKMLNAVEFQRYYTGR
jgi:hypothetical protein